MNDAFTSFIKSKMVGNKIEFTKEELAMVLYQFTEATLTTKAFMDGVLGRETPKAVLMKAINEAIDEQL